MVGTRVRGLAQFELILLVVSLVVWAAIIAGSYYGGKHVGAAEVQASWDKDKINSANGAQRTRDALKGEVRLVQDQLGAARLELARSNDKLRRAENAAKGKSMVAVDCPAGGDSGAGGETVVSGSPGGGGDAPRHDPVVRVTWRFVGLWDGAWTDRGGQPVFGDPAVAAASDPAADTASPLGPDELRENHQLNAARCSDIARDYGALSETVNRLEAKWNSERKSSTLSAPTTSP